MPKYAVYVTWTGSRVYEVEASDEHEAEELALEMAETDLFSDSWDEMDATAEEIDDGEGDE